MSGTTVGFWCAFTIGILVGLIFSGFAWVPYQHRRWERRNAIDRADIVRMTAGYPSRPGRHALADPDVTLDLRDADGAFAQASAAPLPSPYPGPGRVPEPEWVRWVEEHGRSATRPPKPPRWRRWLDKGRDAAFGTAFVGLNTLWRLDRWLAPAYAFMSDLRAVFEPPLIDPPRVLRRKLTLGGFTGLKQ